MEFPIGTPVSTMAPIIESYADAGIQAQLLAGLGGRIPTAAEAANLATWAAAFGPGGSFWAGKDFPARLAVDRIEFGNESSGFWQYAELNGVSDWAHSTFYAQVAEDYGKTFKSTSIAVHAANPGVGLLAVADVPGRWHAWMDGMFRGTPDLANYVDGWVIHPYGPGWQLTIDDAMSQAASHGAPNSIPLYLTETGITSDNGNCLSDNSGWDTCMSYGQAANALISSVDAMKARYGGRIKEIDFYCAGDLRDHDASQDREHYFGALTAVAGEKGAYSAAVRSLLATTT